MQYFIDIFKRDQSENDQNNKIMVKERLQRKNGKTLKALQKPKKKGDKQKKDDEMVENEQ